MSLPQLTLPQLTLPQRIFGISALVAFAFVLIVHLVFSLELIPLAWLVEGAESQVARSVMVLSGCGLLCASLVWFLRKMSAALALSISIGLGVLVGFEALAGPFVPVYTTIFAKDPVLGWRLRPGASDEWLGFDVDVNSRGMRGHEPASGSNESVLFLGDSVTFGAFLERDLQTIPAMSQAALKARGLNVQCLNGGVGGWSTWQEEAWLTEVGPDLKPDIVVINLVLNDATESILPASDGGAMESFQLARSIDQSFYSRTTWARALRSLRRNLRGEELRDSAASASALGVYELLRSPELPASRAAWSAHLLALGSLVSRVRELGAIPVLVAHPYTVQFEVPTLWWPQESYARWAREAGVSFLNAAQAVSDLPRGASSYYHDGVHPNKEGAALIGRLIAAHLVEEGLLP